MKSIQNKKMPMSRKMAIFSLVSVLLAASVVAGMFVTKTGFFSASDQVKTQKDKDEQNNSTLPTQTDKSPAQNDQPSSDPTTKDTLTASFTYIRQDDTSVQIGTLIESTASNGSCNLTLTKDGKEVTRSSDTQILASSSTCKGFDVPMVELSPGLWTIKLDIKVGSTEANLSDTITID